MSVLHRKLRRDLRRLVGQVLTIALVVAAGIAAYVSTHSAWTTLTSTRDAYYQRERFGHVWATLERAPMGAAQRLAAIPGVRTVYPRVVVGVALDIPTDRQPPVGLVVSMPVGAPPPLGGVVLAEGRMPDPARTDEAVLLESFAAAWGVAVDDSLPVVLQGVRRELRVVGLANSPEYVFAMPPGSVAPDLDRLAVLWMPLPAVAPAARLEGAFNDVVLALHPGASVPAVVAQVDRELARYGGLGAHGRDRQASNYLLDQELEQLRGMATVTPVMFLFVAAFLIHVVLSRLVALQRPEIATLKAVGYPDLAIGLHFLQLVAVVTVGGAALGVAVGAWLGQGLIDMYRPYFHFPDMTWSVRPADVAVALLVTAGAAIGGALGAVYGVVRLPPAEAMRPPSPPAWHRSWLDAVRLDRVVGQAGQMVLRETRRHPFRLAFSAIGIAFAVAILVVGRFSIDAIELLIQRQFRTAFREDLAVTLREPVPVDDARALRAIAGVEHLETLRVVPVRARAGHRSREVAVIGYPDGGRLRRVVDGEGDPVPLPEAGLALTRKLGEVLGVGVGDRVELDLLDGDRRTVTAPVAALVDEYLGVQIHMRADALSGLLRESPRASVVLLDVDPAARARLLRKVRDLPGVASVDATDEMVARFRQQIDDSIGLMSLIIVGFASVLSVGIVYNNARVALSQRGRDLASLRVLGFTRGEISAVLLGEMAIQVVLGIPLGIWLGLQLALGIASTVDPERYRLPSIISPNTVAWATGVTLLAALASALLVRRRLDHLDLVAVLKTRE